MGLLVNIYQFCLAMISGILAVGYGKIGEVSKGVTTMCIFLMSSILYQGVLELCEKISNPLGDDDVDFPMYAFESGTEKACYAMFAAEAREPWKDAPGANSFFDQKP